MSFQRPEFILFFVSIFIIYWLLSHRAQNMLLLGASAFFCGCASVKFLALALAEAAVTFCAGILLDRFPRHKKKVLLCTICINLVLLGFFKYYNFFVENINYIFSYLQISTSLPTLQIILPLGISFYTLQNIGYIVDIYRGQARPCRKILDYCLFVIFFPKLISGPIERASNLLVQIEKPRTINFNDLMSGLILLLWGCVQKSVIADNIAVISNKVFLLREPGFFILSAGTFAYTLQILADFSGYTDIARGCSHMLGFNLLKNFNNPYFAKNPSDFWRRWHMSLSQWIRDYIYIPLGGSRVSPARWAAILFVTFFATGLWHGASWNFIMWGIYYWLLYMLYRCCNALVPDCIKHARLSNLMAIPLMFFFTNIGWLIFRETDSAYLRKYFTSALFNWNADHALSALYIIWYTGIYALPLFAFSCYIFYIEKRNAMVKIPESLALQTGLSLILYVVFLAMKSTYENNFIYLNF
jgi:alginate O-acetyltransferase complex protein AlgI